VWCRDGSLVFTSVADGALYRVAASGEVTTVAVVGGGANAAAPTVDGGFVVTQNGGIDFAGLANLPAFDADGMPPYAPITPGIQVVDRDGAVRYFASDGFLAPNDLTAAPDGTLYFTDPPHHPPPPEPLGRVHAIAPDGFDSRGRRGIPLLQRHRARAGWHDRGHRGARRAALHRRRRT